MKSVLLFCLIFLFGCNSKPAADDNSESAKSGQSLAVKQVINLLENNSLDQWTFYLADSTVSPQTIWSVKDSIVQCSGAVNGYMRTNENYSDYKLTLDWRWSEEPGNSGVLLHITGTDNVWPKCIEAQLMSGNAGDFYLIGGSTVKEQVDKTSRRIEKKSENSENPAGEWNHYEIICSADQITLYVNGVLQNKASQASLQSGMIGLQSEGKPIEFKNIYLEPVTE